MKIDAIMTAPVETCGPDDNLGEAARAMWTHDCGVLPVVAADGHVQGILTDRDICMALATRDRPAARIAVREVATQAVHACVEGDDVETALDTMRTQRIRRLPVLDRDGHLKGLLSINDIVLHAGKRPGEVAADRLVAALKGICSHRAPVAAV